MNLTLDHYKALWQGEEVTDDAGNHQSVEHSSDLVAFISGLLLGNDANVRIWFAHYIRGAQKVMILIFNPYLSQNLILKNDFWSTSEHVLRAIVVGLSQY